MNLAPEKYRQVRVDACARAGLDPANPEPIRIGENTIFRPPDRLVIRIARP